MTKSNSSSSDGRESFSCPPFPSGDTTTAYVCTVLIDVGRRR